MKKKIKNSGFTLIEVMVSMVIAGLMISGIYGVYTIQQRSYTVQGQVTEMQQKIRAALDFMTSEIRMAGYDPGSNYDPLGICDGAGVLTADLEHFVFEYCDSKLQTDGSYIATREKSTYSMYSDYASKTRYDAYGDGIYDLGIQHGDTPSTKRALAEGVDAFEFLYFQSDGKTPATTPAAVRVVKVSMLVRATYPDPKYTNKLPYTLESGTVWNPPPGDHYHRRLLITSIKLRNFL